MIELPGSLRDVLVERIDEEIDAHGASTPEQWVEAVLVGLDAAAEELDEDLGENLVKNLEESGELEQSLSDELEEQFEDLDDGSGEDLVRILDGVCEIAWVNEDGDEEIAKGFMESDGYEDEEY
tara:strand:- start:1163 stop:1534 length:372 start_codon:yes stop_codon:yes gene_type:complete